MIDYPRNPYHFWLLTLFIVWVHFFYCFRRYSTVRYYCYYNGNRKKDVHLHVSHLQTSQSAISFQFYLLVLSFHLFQQKMYDEITEEIFRSLSVCSSPYSFIFFNISCLYSFFFDCLVVCLFEWKCTYICVCVFVDGQQKRFKSRPNTILFFHCISRNKKKSENWPIFFDIFILGEWYDFRSLSFFSV